MFCKSGFYVTIMILQIRFGGLTAMVLRYLSTYLIVCGFALIVLACGNSEEALSPSTTDRTNNIAATPQHNLWGMYDVAINAQTGEIESVPIRTADFNANVVRFLQPPLAPFQLMSIKLNQLESDLPAGRINMEITLRHPFPGNTVFRGFDVHGIVMADGLVESKYNPELKWNSPDGTRMINPDGFTRWWNQVEFTSYGKIFGYTEGHLAKPGYISTSTLNPYKLFAFGLDSTQPYYQLPVDQRWTFPAVDGVFSRTYIMQFDASQFPIYKFKYAIDACWAPPDQAYKPTFPVQAFPPDANAREPYMVRILEFEEIPYYVDEWVSGGNMTFLMNIGVWQATGGNVLDHIAHVWLESPTLFEAPIDVRDTMEFVESPHPTQATFRVSLEKMSPSGLFGQQLLISVETPYTYEPNIQGDTSGWIWPEGALSAHFVATVPITNLTPEGDYAYCYFLPDWCATMRTQCSNDADNQVLMANMMSQNIEGYYNDYTHVQVWEGKVNTQGQNSASLQATCQALGYSFQRTQNQYFDATGSRVVIAILFNTNKLPPTPPFTYEESQAMQEFIQNGGLLFFMCEASFYFNEEGLAQLFEWLGMLMQYGGGATPEMSDGYTSNITWHWLTEDVNLYHYYTCGQWITQDPHVLTLVATEYDEKLILMYPLPLE